MASRILLIDDDEGVRKSLSRGLRRAKMHVVTAPDGGSAMSLLERDDPFDVVLSDLRMPGVDGLTLLRFSRSLDSPPPFILFSAYGSRDVISEALEAGAEEFLEKPIDPRDLLEHVRRALERGPSAGADLFEGFVAGGDWFGEFAARMRRVAQSDVTVLIEGETGTGKTLVARALWRLSRRHRGPFIAVNCAAIPEHLLESELFGHVKGAFTGATASRVGRIHQADGGVLFLDEVGELRIDMQAKLLHVLQERRFHPVGSSHDVEVDVRFMAATNQRLDRAVESGAFRRDLYYRLNVVRVEIPALRERPQDVPVLIDHFRHRWQVSTGLRAPAFERNAVDFLMGYDWPGNVRELENLVERAAVVLPCGVDVDIEAFERYRLLASELGVPELFGAGAGAGLAALDADAVLEQMTFADAVTDFERRLILRALERCQGNRSEAARLLGLNRTTLLAKLKRLGID